MQVQTLELSNIVSKEQHYLREQNIPTFDFQHQPITHNFNKKSDKKQKKLIKYKEMQDRRQLLEKSQRIKKQLLLQKIATKNFRYQIRQHGQKQNKKTIQISQFLSRNKSPQTIKQQHQESGKPETKDIQKIYLKNPKINFSSTKGFKSSQIQQKDEKFRKNFNVKDQNRLSNIPRESKGFKQIKLKAVKLPQLNSNKQESLKQIQKDQILQKFDMNRIQVQKPRKNVNSGQQKGFNPILKIHDPRYFGIESSEQDFQKISRSLLKQIKKKYWNYESLDSEQVLNNFQNLLAEQIM